MAQAPPAPTLPRPTPIKPVPPPLNSPEGQARMAKAPSGEGEAPKPMPVWRRRFGAAVPWLAALFLVGLVVQVFFAGYGLLEVGGKGMDWHIAFSHIIELLPLLLILCGFLGGDKFGGSLGIVLFVLFFAQYAFVEATGPPVVRALHPTNAAVMLVVTTWLVLRRPIWHGKSN